MPPGEMNAGGLNAHRLNVIIADDEALGRERLRIFIDALNAEGAGIVIAAECSGGRAAVAAVQKMRPDLLLLDIRMPDLDGFGVVRELVAAIPGGLPQIVFVTAHNEHAMRAFEAHALDFILKPVSRERLAQALARARVALAANVRGSMETRLRAWSGGDEASPRARPVREDASFAALRAAQAGVPQAHHAALPLGYMLHEYQIERVLGQGGFGVTDLAYDVNLRMRVAIKEYLPRDLAVRDDADGSVHPKSGGAGAKYQKGLERFLLESRTLAAFRHANIVGVTRFFEGNNSAYMVMNYEQGESLDAWMKKRIKTRESAPDEKMLKRMFTPLLDGLAKVHAAGFLHRDIKPANIYVRHDDNGERDGSLVLLDFGAAREVAGGMTEAGLTAIFTPGYSPLEQYYRNGSQGPWSDLYAVGGVLYWFVTGKAPIESAARVQQDMLEPASKVAQGKYSAALLKAIDWALMLDEKSRPQSVAEYLPMLGGAAGTSGGISGWIRKLFIEER